MSYLSLSDIEGATGGRLPGSTESVGTAALAASPKPYEMGILGSITSGIWRIFGRAFQPKPPAPPAPPAPSSGAQTGLGQSDYAAKMAAWQQQMAAYNARLAASRGQAAADAASDDEDQAPDQYAQAARSAFAAAEGGPADQYAQAARSAFSAAESGPATRYELATRAAFRAAASAPKNRYELAAERAFESAGSDLTSGGFDAAPNTFGPDADFSEGQALGETRDDLAAAAREIASGLGQDSGIVPSWVTTQTAIAFAVGAGIGAAACWFFARPRAGRQW